MLSVLSKKQERQANVAWELWKNTAFMSPDKFRKLLRDGLADGKRGVSQSDFNNALAMYGTEHYLAGRAKVRKMHEPRSDGDDPTYKDHFLLLQEVSADLFFMEGLTFLISTASPSNYGQIDLLESKEAGPVQEALKLHVMRLKNLGFKVDVVEFDGESSLKDNDKVSSYIGAQFKSLPPDQHAKKAERRVQTLRDRLRSSLSALIFKCPRSLLGYLGKACNNINNWETTTSRSLGMPPNEFILKRRVIADVDFKHHFGQYVQTTRPRGTQHNNLEERTESCIALHPDPNGGGGWYFLKLDSWKVVHRAAAIEQPMPDVVRTLLNERAEAERAERKAALDAVKRKKENKKKLTRAEELLIESDDFHTGGGKSIAETSNEAPIAQEKDIRKEGNELPPIQADRIGQEAEVDGLIVRGPQTASESPVVEQQTEPTPPAAEQGQIAPAPPVVDEGGSLPPSSAVGGGETLTPRTDEVGNLIFEEQTATVEDGGMLEGSAMAARVGRIPLSARMLVAAARVSTTATTDPSIIRKRLIRMIEACGSKLAQLEAIELLESKQAERRSRKLRGKKPARYALNAEIHENGKAQKSKNMTLAEAEKELGHEAATKAAEEEIMQIIDMQVLEPIFAQHMTKKERWETLRTKLFLKVKYKASGALDKIKARLVSGGDDEDKESYDPGSLWSPTVALPSTMLTLGTAAFERRHIAILDIKAAFLNENLQEGTAIRVKLTKECTKILLHMYPEMAKFVDPKEGVFYSWLKKSLYGIVQASSNLFRGIREMLKSMNFRQNGKDDCVFNKIVGNKKITINLYVDDLLITATTDELIDEFIAKFKERYKDVTIKRGEIMDYLGMQLEYTRNGKITLSMKGYIEKMLRQWNEWNPKDLVSDMKKYESPHDANLFSVNDNSPLITEENRERFHSLVGVLMFLTKRARIDCLTSLSFLSGRVQAATEEDWSKLKRLISYLSLSRDRKLVLQPSSMKLEIYVDASYGSHSDRRSHSGTVMTLGGMPFLVKSSRQKQISKSSCEAEIVCLSDASGWIVWAHQWLTEQGYEVPPAIVWEDNQSVIKLITKGKPASDASRHFEIRYFYIKELIDMGRVDLRYLKSEENTGDLLSKGTSNEVFHKLSEKLMTSASDV